MEDASYEKGDYICDHGDVIALFLCAY